ncbi:MAG TPA: hypothetical protein VN667_22340 [Burkholderiales bacterium]|nr:hypothetical protein [Burkholderiales bacterium]
MSSDRWPAKILIHKPTAVMPARESAPAYTVDRPLQGLKVGLRHDGLWQSWKFILELWSAKMAAAGAHPLIIQVSEHTGSQTAATEAALEDWIRRIDCAIVGVGT